MLYIVYRNEVLKGYDAWDPYCMENAKEYCNSNCYEVVNSTVTVNGDMVWFVEER